MSAAPLTLSMRKTNLQRKWRELVFLFNNPNEMQYVSFVIWQVYFQNRTWKLQLEKWVTKTYKETLTISSVELFNRDYDIR